jgi:RNA polymerase sigma-70 factor (ECF subfamily)
MSRLHRGRKLLQRSLYNHALALGIVKGEPMSEAREVKARDEVPADLAAFRAKKRGAA